MTTNFTGPRLVPDDGDAELTSLLRQLYAAPDAPLYWTGLQQRIIDRITGREAADSWWVVPAQWARIGLIAAGFALIVAGSLYLRSRAEQREMAYESVVGQEASGPTIAIREGKTDRQTTYNYINGR